MDDLTDEERAVVGGGRSRKVAGVLALLLGGVGAHKFYLGQTLNAVLYLVFCFTLVPALLGLIDGIRILMMTDVGFRERFG
jgi:TM2 domain-containing membrane protein YozV